MWDLGQEGTTVDQARNNLAPALQIADWVRRNGTDPWREIEAIVAYTDNRYQHHDALLPIHTGQCITLIGPPVWFWENGDVVAGEYDVPANTFNQRIAHIHSYRALLGLVPSTQLVPRFPRSPFFV